MWMIMARNSISPEVNVKVLRSALHPMQCVELRTICCGVALKRMGMLGVSVRKMKALNDKMETVTLIDK